jgi:hypothetical protein
MRNILARLGQAALLALILVIGSMVIGCPSYRCISEQDARVVAARRLDEYVEREKLEVANFGPPETNHTAGHWVFDFRSVSTPRHLVAVIVHCDGGSEVSRAIEP